MQMTEQMGVKSMMKEIEKQRKVRLQHIVDLGELTHRQLLGSETHHETIAEISAHITEADQVIYALNNKVTLQTLDKAKCPNCHVSISPDVKFCGNCGTVNTLFQMQSVQGKECNLCHQSIQADAKFCPSCGVAQGVE